MAEKKRRRSEAFESSHGYCDIQSDSMPHSGIVHDGASISNERSLQAEQADEINRFDQNHGADHDAEQLIDSDSDSDSDACLAAKSREEIHEGLPSNEKHPGGRPRKPLPDLDAPLFDGSKINLGQTITMILEFCTAYGLSRSGRDALCALINNLLPINNAFVDANVFKRILRYNALIDTERIDICEDGCRAFSGEHSMRDSCDRCGKPRYTFTAIKKNGKEEIIKKPKRVPPFSLSFVFSTKILIIYQFINKCYNNK